MHGRMALLKAAVFIVILAVSCEAKVESKAPNLIGSDSTSSSEHTLVCTDCQLVDVTKVIDGDTLDTSVGRVRFFGIDTPEKGDPPVFLQATRTIPDPGSS